ncbi:MAG: isoprenyl transferase [Clostridia bacterium]|nr:isoprenyl transferase [Clostridia bacterium]MDD4798124.1 isoprenyl transferase [Clostridia bacterium]
MQIFKPYLDDRVKALIDDLSLLEKIDIRCLPQSVAIIMDGNGRWAKKRGLPRAIGHRNGAERLRSIIKLSSALGIKYLTLYTFSTENWKRSYGEVAFLMDLMVEYLSREIDELHQNNIRIVPIGDLSALPLPTRRELEAGRNLTSANSGLTVNIAVNYGGRQELVDAVRLLAEQVCAGELTVEQIDEKAISDRLYTAGQIDPDLLIRTSGELRLSNYLLYQSAYSELYFTDVLWPDFSADEYLKALADYGHRERRFGKESSVKRGD